MVWQVGGPKGHGAELMINIAIVSMHAILYIDILGHTFVMSGGAMAPLAPPVPPPMIKRYTTSTGNTSQYPTKFIVQR